MVDNKKQLGSFNVHYFGIKKHVTSLMKNFLLMTDSLFLMLLRNLHFSNNKERAVHVDINDYFSVRRGDGENIEIPVINNVILH